MKDFDPTLSDTELNELDDLLTAPALEETAMDVSTLEGFLTAVAIGPSIVMPSQWLPWVWDLHEGRHGPGFRDMEEANHILNLVMRLYNDLMQRFQDAPQDFEPVFRRGAQWGEAQWCEGFLLGMQFQQKAWNLLIKAKPEWFAPCMRLATDESREFMEKEGSAERSVSEIAPSVVKIKAFWDFWKEQSDSPSPGGLGDDQDPVAGAHAPVMRQGPKVGRNDPCPCGSGKKYKKCCGATVH
jgi:uncharacterized protein